MIRTRFAPSPTGKMHIGNARTALFSALYAMHRNGCFLLRIEDTDAARSESSHTLMVQDDLHWLGIQWQEGPLMGGPHGPYFQSERHSIYDQYYQRLEASGHAYPCFCTEQALALARKLQLSRGQAPRYPGTCATLSEADIAARLAEGLKPTLRFRLPIQGKIEFIDLVKGPQQFYCADIGDFIIRRADGSSSFLFCNAIDDSLMEVTHVLRGEDHLSNTPRQLLILQTLEMQTPHYGHLSLIMGEDGTPLSKRHGSSSLHDLREQGYLPRAVLNYFSRLGHVYEQTHLMTLSELASSFHVEKLSRSSARFDLQQLLHWQKEAVLALDDEALWLWLGTEGRIVPNEARYLFIEMVRQNVHFPREALIWEEILFGNALVFTEEHVAVFKKAGEAFFIELIHGVEQHQMDLTSVLNVMKVKLQISGKSLFMPIRLALTGKEQGPELALIVNLLGQQKMSERFQQALACVRRASC